MNTGNTVFLDQTRNREYYVHSDGNYMPLDQSLYSHKFLERVKWVREKVYELDSDKHVDIGSKDGYLCLTLAAEGIDCIGIDPSSDAITQAKLKARQAGIGVEYIEAFVEDIDFHGKCDTVSCMEVIEHVVDPDFLVQKLCSIGKHVMITTPDALGRHGLEDAKRNQEHVRVYTKEELVELVSKYGEVLETKLADDQIMVLIRSNE